MRLGFDLFDSIGSGWMVNLRPGRTLSGKQMTVSWERRGE
jgi:hypothetical protein